MTNIPSLLLKALHVVMALLLAVSLSAVAASPAEAVEIAEAYTKEMAPVDLRELLPEGIQRRYPKINTALGAEIAARPGEDIPIIIMLEEQPGLIRGRLDLDGAKSLANAAQAPLAQLLEGIDAANVTQHWIINAISGTVPAESIAQIAARPDVRSVLLDEVIKLPDPVFETAELPEDYGDLLIRAPEMWAKGFDGTGIIISILDTGICWFHPDLDAGKVIASRDFTTLDIDVSASINATETRAHPMTLRAASDLEVYLTWDDPANALTLIVTDPYGHEHLGIDVGDRRQVVHIPGTVMDGDWTVTVVGTVVGTTESYLLEKAFYSVWDDQGHGTHVGGTAAGEYNPGAGTIGVASGATLLNARVLNTASWGLSSWIIEGIEWSVERGAHILNLSLGDWQRDGTGRDPIDLAITHAVAAGHIAVISAGNWGPAECTISSPGTAHGAIGVAASDINDRITPFSSRGPAGDGRIGIDLAAPGSYILAPVPLTGHEAWSGTSMSAPHVAGAAALLLEAFPALTPSEMERALKNTADDLTFGILEQGAGRLDVTDAYRALREGILVDHEWSVGRVLPGDHTKAFTVINNAAVKKILSIVWTPMTDTQDVPAGNWMTMPAAVTVPAGEMAIFAATMSIPDRAAGTYIGYIALGDIVIPVSANVIQPLAPATSVKITGTVDEIQDNIYYTIDVKPGVTELSLSLDWTDAGNDLDIYVFDPEGHEAARSFYEHPETISIDQPAPGKWTVVVWAWRLPEVIPETYTLRAFSPTIALTPGHGVSGTEVTVEGAGFPVEAAGIVEVLPAGVVAPIPFHTDGDGTFLLPATILLKSPPGEATFVVNVAGVVATALFMVWGPQTIALYPTYGYEGTVVTIAGEWFDAGLEGHIAANVTGVISPVQFVIDEHGSFEVEATILPDAPLGEATFAAMKADTVLAEATFTVTEVPPFDFSLAVHPTEITLGQGEHVVTSQVGVDLVAGIAEEVTLTYSLPAGVQGITITFSLLADETPSVFWQIHRLTLDATLGEHEITIIGTSAGGLIREVTHTVIVVEPRAHFRGRVTIGDELAPEGIVVSARIEGVEVDYSKTIAHRYCLTVPFSPDAIVDFYVEGVWAASHPWKPAAWIELDLSILGFDFSLAVDNVTVTQGDEITATLTATLEAGIPERVTINYTLPEGVAGITVTFDPAVGKPAFEFTMTIAVATDATLGEHQIAITGTAGWLERTVTFTLTVQPPARYTLTVTIDPLEGGRVIRSPEPDPDGKYVEGTVVTLTAKPAAGWEFERWSGDVVGYEPTLTLTMDADKSVTAHFAAVVPPPIEGDVTGDGKVDASDLALVAGAFNTPDAAPDINADGIVDIFDLVLVGRNFGGGQEK